MKEASSELLAWWGAGLSTLLGVVKLLEFWRDRFRVDVARTLTGSESIGNEIFIRNLSIRPVIMEHWELLRRTGRWPRCKYEAILSAEHDDGDVRIDPHSTLTLRFAGENYFGWGHNVKRKGSIHIRLYLVGRKPKLFTVWAP